MELKNTCRKCAQCCITQKIPINLTDIFKISAHLNTAPESFVQKYLKLTDHDGEKTYIINQIPCPFLKDNLCSIHNIKPTACKITPCPKNKKYNKIKKTYGQITLNFLTNTKKDMLIHFISEEHTGHYLKNHKEFSPAAAEKYKEQIEKDLKNKLLTQILQRNIIKLSIHPKFQAQITKQDN